MDGPRQHDPVCGMMVHVDRAPARTTHEGDRYHFCSRDCRDRFVQNPQRYLGYGSEVLSEDSSSEPESAENAAGGDPRPCPECGTTVTARGEGSASSITCSGRRRMCSSGPVCRRGGPPP